ncbi:MAG: aldehyde dehydrogenase family protein, partial [Thermodesulfobacteriota bacterium]|nr:aldehyde dehydrogenase family protein [Thermodesulfobacteriota bacterium]
LISHPDIDFIILTGGTETGLAVLAEKPDVYLAAETGGKNATIMTAMSDRGQAIKNVVYSAFGHCGQKCSATSLLILEKEVFDDPHFKKKLIDAVQSLSVGSAWDFHNRMGPMIKPPGDELELTLTQLTPGETWALTPEKVDDNPHIWTPGIKWDVQPGSRTHRTEFFGPLLGVMRADNLSQAIDYANQTGYGLTSGLESLDRREQDQWKARINAGNLYINRGTTGAIVLRQPFGGMGGSMGKSALGSGIKTGGPHYATQFMNFTETGLPRVGAIEKETRLLRLVQQWQQQLDWGRFPEIANDLKKTVRAIKSYLYHAEQTFNRKKDYFHLRGQDNILRYLPLGEIVVRIHVKDSLFDALARIAAVIIARSRPVISIPPDLDNLVTAFIVGRHGKELLEKIEIIRQNDIELITSMARLQRIRYAAPERVPGVVFDAAAKTGFYIARTPVLMEGSIELIHYFGNQSICDAYHRYGNLGERGMTSEIDG